LKREGTDPIRGTSVSEEKSTEEEGGAGQLMGENR